jgi:hypothetical protein
MVGSRHRTEAYKYQAVAFNCFWCSDTFGSWLHLPQLDPDCLSECWPSSCYRLHLPQAQAEKPRSSDTRGYATRPPPKLQRILEPSASSASSINKVPVSESSQTCSEAGNLGIAGPRSAIGFIRLKHKQHSALTLWLHLQR